MVNIVVFIRLQSGTKKATPTLMSKFSGDTLRKLPTLGIFLMEIAQRSNSNLFDHHGFIMKLKYIFKV